jgi:hypothetical protein
LKYNPFKTALKIEPLENGLYRIIEGGNKLGVIYAEAEGDQVKWSTEDELGGRFCSADR